MLVVRSAAESVFAAEPVSKVLSAYVVSMTDGFRQLGLPHFFPRPLRIISFFAVSC